MKVFDYLFDLENGKENFNEKKFEKLIEKLSDDEIYNFYIIDGITFSVFDLTLTMKNREPYYYLFGKPFISEDTSNDY